MEDPDDVVDGSLINRQPAVVLFLDKREDLFLRHIDIDGRHIQTAGQDALDRHIAELQGGGDQVPLGLIDLALLFHVLNDIVDIILCDRHRIVSLRHPGRRIADPGQKSRCRIQERHEETQQP